MKINEVLECFNRALDIKGNPKGIHYVARTTIEKKIGTCKQATTTITLCDPQAEPKDIISVSGIMSVPTGQEDVLMENMQKKALTEFIIRLLNDTGT